MKFAVSSDVSSRNVHPKHEQHGELLDALPERVRMPRQHLIGGRRSQLLAATSRAHEECKFIAWRDKNKCEPSFSAVDYHDFIDKKIDDIRKETDSASAPSYAVHGTSNLNQFKTVDVDLVTKTIREFPTKYCNLDPIPTWLVKDCASLLAPYITHIVNHSVIDDSFSSQWNMQQFRL